jgi:glycosyltransferase involved in cell wall biosynthesis
MKIAMCYRKGVKETPFHHYMLSTFPDLFVQPKQIDIELNKARVNKINKYKVWIKKFIRFFRIPSPNISYVTISEDYDMVWGAQCIPITDKPFVCDFEMFWQPFLENHQNWATRFLVNALLSQDNCKGIFFWAETAMMEFRRYVDDEVWKKCHVFYPPIQAEVKQKRNSPPVFGFVSRYFYEKGGAIALEYMEKHNVRGIIAGDYPSLFPPKSKNIKILGMIPREKLKKEFYEKIDVLIYPGISDSFGFAFLEAMSYGIPIMTMHGYARKELIGDCGQVFNSKEELLDFVPNKEFLSLGVNGHKRVKKGDFSVKNAHKFLNSFIQKYIDAGGIL